MTYILEYVSTKWCVKSRKIEVYDSVLSEPNTDYVTFIPEENLEYYLSNVNFKNSNVNIYILPLLESKYWYSFNIKHLAYKVLQFQAFLHIN